MLGLEHQAVNLAYFTLLTKVIDLSQVFISSVECILSLQLVLMGTILKTYFSKVDPESVT